MLKPSETPWQVVVLARWNRAIFTPKGIARRLFGLKEGGESKIQALVPMDTIAPIRVTIDGISVLAGDDAMIVEPQKKEYTELARAAEIMKAAVTSLPETPYTAAGINLAFSVPGNIKPLAGLWNASIDERLRHSGYSLKSHGLHRSLEWRSGEINLAITQAEGKDFELRFNFHRCVGSNVLIAEWLSTPATVIQEEVERLASVLGCEA